MRSPGGEGLDRQAPDRGRGLVRQQSEPDRGGDAKARAASARPSRNSSTRSASRERAQRKDVAMSSVTEAVGGNPSTSAPMLDLHEIQATVLRPRPAPYFGTHVLLRIDDAAAGRDFLRRLTPHIDSAAHWWSAANAWLAIGISYAGLEALGLPEGLAAKLPRGIPRGHGGARPAAPRRRRQRSEELGRAVRHGPGPHRGERIQRFRGKVAARARDRPRAVRGLLGRQRPARCRTSALSRATSIRWVTRTASISRRSRAAASSRCRARGRRSRPASSSSDIRVRPAFPCRCRSRTSSAATAPM